MKKYIFISLITLLLSCDKTIEIQNSFDFDLQMLPVLQEAELGVPVEMRFNIHPIGGEYINTQYYARFFLFSGRGLLMNESGEAFFPNDDYLLLNKRFRLYYTPNAGTQHNLQIVFFDNFGHEKEIEIQFSVQNSETE